MRITDIKLRELRGELEVGRDFWQERVMRPIDVYPEHRSEPPAVPLMGPSDDTGVLRISWVFPVVETDEGVTGMAGPISQATAYTIDTELTEFLIGEDPLASERVWDKLYRHLIHGRKGDAMFAVSAVDCALWDLKGKWLGQPVYRLLGGPVRTEIPAYASALGFSIDPERAAERAARFAAEGYSATKWFVRHGPQEGEAGLRRNVELMRVLRESVGDDVDVMLDAWNSWDVRYTLEISRRVADYRPRWIEEPVKPDDIDNYARIRAGSPVPIAGGEHEYTRWGARAYLRAGAVDVFQPDIYWAGGISEVAKICAMAAAYDVQVIPHGCSVPATAHLLAAQPVTVSPLIEYLVKWNEINQFFFADPVKPVGGMITPPDRPGIGVEIDESKIRAERTLRWR